MIQRHALWPLFLFFLIHLLFCYVYRTRRLHEMAQFPILSEEKKTRTLFIERSSRLCYYLKKTNFATSIRYLDPRQFIGECYAAAPLHYWLPSRDIITFLKINLFKAAINLGNPHCCII